MIIIDTDIVIDFLRQHPAAIAWIGAQSDPVCLPGISAFELYQGCHNKREVQDLHVQLKPFAVLWPDVDRCNALLTTFMSARLSHSLGIMDALIAATALTWNSPLYTFNRKHFMGVPKLQTIQPYGR